MTSKSPKTAHAFCIVQGRAVIKTPGAQKILGDIGRTSLHKGISNGTYPAPFKLPGPDGKPGRPNYWYVDELETWVQESRIEYFKSKDGAANCDAFFHNLARPQPHSRSE